MEGRLVPLILGVPLILSGIKKSMEHEREGKLSKLPLLSKWQLIFIEHLLRARQPAKSMARMIPVLTATQCKGDHFELFHHYGSKGSES